MRLILFIVNFALLSTPVFAGEFDTLLPSDQASIQKGEVVSVFSPNVDTETNWPKTAFYQRIEATPEEATAIFADFGSQKDYIKNLKDSHIAQQLSPLSFIVDYQVRIPFFFAPFIKDSHYTVRDDLDFNVSTNTYTVKWVLVKEGFFKKLAGQVIFEPLGTDTLVAYVNEMTPSSHSSMNSGIAVNEMKKSGKESFDNIVKRISHIRNNQNAFLQEQVIKLRTAFGQ